jgi:branched-chain amino acid transport system permease protein
MAVDTIEEKLATRHAQSQLEAKLAFYKRIGLIGLIIFAVALPFLVSDFRTFQFTRVLYISIAVLGLNILSGYNGQFSLGHGAFIALGAYVAAIMMDRWGVPYYLTIIPAGLIGFIFGFLIGLPARRLEGLYLALATFGLALATPQILKKFEIITMGVQGIVVDKPEVPFGLPISQDQWLYFFTLMILLVLFWAARNLLRARTGRAFVAIRDHHMAAESMGVNAGFYKPLAFAIGGAYAGVAGALATITIQFVAPDSFGVFLSITLLVGSVIGGIASIGGAIFGGIAIVFIPNVAEEISKAAPWAIYGVILILFMYAMPSGIMGFINMLWRGYVKRLLTRT